MRRRANGTPVHAPAFPPEADSAQQLALMVEGRGKRQRAAKKQARGIPNADWKVALEKARGFIQSGDWSEATPRHYVAAYALLHEQVYGVAPSELDAQARLFAAGMAMRMLKKEFGENGADMAAFLRWTWIREVGREKWRRENSGGGGGRITARMQFNGAILTDYRLELARKGKL